MLSDYHRAVRSLISDDAPRAAALEARCKICGAVAIELQLFEPVNAHDKPHLVIDGFLNHIETVIGPEAFTLMQTYLVTQDLAGIVKLDWEWMPCWCLVCEAIYCREHWTKETLFDEGFYDCVRGTCPLGHVRTIDD